MSDSKVLSQEEVDALLKASQNAADFTAGLTDIGEGKLGGASDIQKSLEKFHEMAAADCTRNLTSFLRHKISVKSKSISEMFVRDHLKDSEEKNVYTVFLASPNDCYGMVIIDLCMLDQVINYLYGGHNTDKATAMTSPGKIGIIIAEKLSEIILEAIVSSSKEYGKFSYQINKTIAIPTLTSKVSMDDKVYVLNFNVFLGELETTLSITLPSQFITQFFSFKMVEEAKPVESNFWRSAIETQVVDSYVNINAVLPDVNMKITELLSLKPGDLIPIGDPTSVYVCLNNLKLFRAVAGQANSKRVVKILSEV